MRRRGNSAACRVDHCHLIIIHLKRRAAGNGKPPLDRKGPPVGAEIKSVFDYWDRKI